MTNGFWIYYWSWLLILNKIIDFINNFYDKLLKNLCKEVELPDKVISLSCKCDFKLYPDISIYSYGVRLELRGEEYM